MNDQEQSYFTKRISISDDGTQANGQSGSNDISNNGRFIPFESNATNLIPNDFNQKTDLFVYDSLKQSVELISIAPDGTQANASSSVGSISSNGRYITFASFASNLVAEDNNDQRDIFVYDRILKTTDLISIATDGTQANDTSDASVISNDGRYVAFLSEADNLVPADTNGFADLFIYDRALNTTERINLAPDGTEANSSTNLGSISDDGRYISFTSNADNLVPEDTNGKSDIFVYDRALKTTERVSVGEDNTQANGNNTSSSISGNGQYVVYQSDASNLVSEDTNGKSDIFVYDRALKTTERVSVTNDDSQSNGDSQEPSISDDGRYVAFLSDADNLSADTTDSKVFVRDRVEQTTRVIEADSFPIISGNGKNVLFNSSLNTLVEEDTNDTGDVFLVSESDADLSRYATDDVHRFYQYEKGFHLYTTDDNEIEVVQQRSEAGELAYQYEAEKYTVLSDNKDALTGETLEGVKPVYRFFNRETGAHLYTTDENERSVILDTLSNYNFEGIKYYAFDTEPTEIETIPVFRMLNSDSGSHLFTIDQNELNYIQEKLPNFSFENNGNAVFHVFEL